jgi:heme/copper-type cytochrome/quinol oxidase subunit 1
VWHHLIDHRVRDLCQCAQPEPAPVPCLDQLSGVGPEGVDRQLARSFFWFTGHRLVYFWLLPAHISWHAMLPKQAGGRLFSHPLACLSFWLFLALSVPLGFHHSTPIREWRLAGSWCMRS